MENKTKNYSNNINAMEGYKQVYTTKDYGLFKPIGGNRNKNVMHISRLRKSMAEHYLFTVIIVNERHEIIDGQHRFEVIKELNLPLNYIICDGYGLEHVQILNQNSKTWNADDYMNGYSNIGYGDYIIYKKFREKYQFGHNESMAMLTGTNTTNGDSVVSFKNGTFKVKHYDDACSQADMLMMIEPYYNGFRRRSFVYAMLIMLDNPKFDFYEFLKKLKIQPLALKNCSEVKQYIDLIEQIYNYHRRDKVSLKY